MNKQTTTTFKNFTAVSSPDLGLDIQDDMGRHEVGFKDNTVKVPFGEHGCRFESHFLINKVGSFVDNILFLSLFCCID